MTVEGIGIAPGCEGCVYVLPREHIDYCGRLRVLDSICNDVVSLEFIAAGIGPSINMYVYATHASLAVVCRYCEYAGVDSCYVATGRC